MTEIRFDDIDAINAAASAEFGDFAESVHISQQMIDTLADLTDDHQWIHTDVERCRTESPFSGRVAHGFLSLSMMRTVPGTTIVGHRAGVNYGAESLRFLAPVPAGSTRAETVRSAGRTE